MGKNSDIAKILLIVIIGMFIPFLCSIAINFGLDITKFNNWLKIGSTFGWFLIIFGIELIAVILYYTLTNKIANKKLKENKPKP
jgi:hypothetical protein